MNDFVNKSKRLKNIYPLIYSSENILVSQYNAQKGKGSRKEVKRFK